MPRTMAAPRGRQARGDRRVAQILDAAAELFAEIGYQKATTNAIAARAGASPGSLYQFFPNKEAVAQALADRYLEQLQTMFDTVLAADFAPRTLAEVLSHLARSLIALTDANPAFRSLFANPESPENLAASAHRLHTAVQEGMRTVVASRAPHLSDDQCARSAVVMVQLVKGLLTVIQAAHGPERAALTVELDRALYGYLAPLAGDHLSPTP